MVFSRLKFHNFTEKNREYTNLKSHCLNNRLKNRLNKTLKIKKFFGKFRPTKNYYEKIYENAGAALKKCAKNGQIKKNEINAYLAINKMKILNSDVSAYINKNKDAYKIGNNDIYLVLGHGCDTGEEFKIPENCTYCPRATCGMHTRVEDRGQIYLIKKFIETKFFTSPDDLNKRLNMMFISALKPYTHHNNTGIHKYNSYHMYSNAVYSLLAYYSIPNYFMYISDRFVNLRIDKFYTIKRIIKDGIYISYSGIIKFDKKDTSNYTYTKNIYSLLFDNDADFNYFYQENNGKDEDTIIKNLNTLYKNKMNENFFIDLIKYTYKYSFFPSVDDVMTIYNEYTDDIDDMETLQKVINDKFIISQAELFHHFPGTYYNIVCRNSCGVNYSTSVAKRKIKEKRE